MTTVSPDIYAEDLNRIESRIDEDLTQMKQFYVSSTGTPDAIEILRYTRKFSAHRDEIIHLQRDIAHSIESSSTKTDTKIKDIKKYSDDYTHDSEKLNHAFEEEQTSATMLKDMRVYDNMAFANNVELAVGLVALISYIGYSKLK
jgi:hypothetical protein